jgi:hypothetical protein
LTAFEALCPTPVLHTTEFKLGLKPHIQLVPKHHLSRTTCHYHHYDHFNFSNIPAFLRRLLNLIERSALHTGLVFLYGDYGIVFWDNGESDWWENFLLKGMYGRILGRFE